MIFGSFSTFLKRAISSPIFVLGGLLPSGLDCETIFMTMTDYAAPLTLSLTPLRPLDPATPLYFCLICASWAFFFSICFFASSSLSFSAYVFSFFSPLRVSTGRGLLILGLSQTSKSGLENLSITSFLVPYLLIIGSFDSMTIFYCLSLL